uniref:Uncharacterized protein n=1 Tax=Nelumbo nucifera TaxID=4432 RepID=A0A822Z712_NELNU|nr:TPA_asm: hypothetical protein HUJ06_007969 [Nelumbo nucifera]
MDCAFLRCVPWHVPQLKGIICVLVRNFEASIQHLLLAILLCLSLKALSMLLSGIFKAFVQFI